MSLKNKLCGTDSDKWFKPEARLWRCSKDPNKGKKSALDVLNEIKIKYLPDQWPDHEENYTGTRNCIWKDHLLRFIIIYCALKPFHPGVCQASVVSCHQEGDDFFWFCSNDLLLGLDKGNFRGIYLAHSSTCQSLIQDLRITTALTYKNWKYRGLGIGWLRK